MRCKQMLSLSVVTVLLAASLAGCGSFFHHSVGRLFRGPFQRGKFRRIRSHGDRRSAGRRIHCRV